MFTFFIFLPLSVCATIIMSICIGWSNEYLFTTIGKFEDGKPIQSYHLCTIPARVVGVLITLASVCLAAASWAVTITTAIFYLV